MPARASGRLTCGLQIVTVAGTLLAAWCLLDPVLALPRNVRLLLDRIRAEPLEARVADCLEGSARNLPDTVPDIGGAFDLLAPAIDGAPPRSLELVLVTAGPPARSLRGTRVLIYRFAPSLWVIPLPLQNLLSGLQELQSTGSSWLLQHIDGTELFLFCGADPGDIAKARTLLDQTLATEGALVPGRQMAAASGGGVHEIAMLRPLFERVRSGGHPLADRLRRLLP